MAYRGEDLDLRTPLTAGRPAFEVGLNETAPRTRASHGMRSEPILVDETVLACCNLAYDLALTHRAGEVRLEHLIYALTRVDAAAEALEGRGIRVAALRRELGSLVASEIPYGAQNSKVSPRRSDDIELILRDAADLAHGRNAPASVDDLIAALIDTARELPALALVRRHVPRRVAAERGDYELTVRGREPVSRAAVLDIHDAAGLRRDEDPRHPAIEQVLDKRLAELFRTWTMLSERLADVERALQTMSSEGLHRWTALSERLVGLEGTLLARSTSSTGADATRLIERIDTIEHVVVERASAAADEATGLAKRLTLIEEGQAAQNVQALQLNAALAAELSSVSAAVAQHPGGEVPTALINERFQSLSAMIERQRGELAAALAQPLGERLNAIERAITVALQKIAGQAASPELGKIHEALARLGAQQTAMAGSIEQLRQGSADAGTISNRLAAIERLTTRPAQIIDQLAEKVSAIHRHTAEKAENRGHFYVWLFGTSDWLAASWPDRGSAPPASR